MFVLIRFLILSVVLFQVAQSCGVGDEGDDNLKKSLDDDSFSEEIEERKLNWKKPNTHNNQGDQAEHSLTNLGNTLVNLWKKQIAQLAPHSQHASRPNKPSEFKSCLSSNGESGVCTSKTVCSAIGGRTNGNCNFNQICCINTLSVCGGTVRVNNTYWSSPGKPTNRCLVTVKLDAELQHQKNIAVCQVRLDFLEFAIAQPRKGKCTDTFRVLGSLSNQPLICGVNDGQHMYIETEPSDNNPTDLQLLFDLEESNRPTWNIKISMIPCGAEYLAPQHCLQYMTTSFGKISSFNWNPGPKGTENHQLNNMQYNICFRNEKIESQRSNRLCVKPCETTTNRSAFLVSNSTNNEATDGYSKSDQSCKTDFLIFQGGQNKNETADRFCGTALNPKERKENVQVCSTLKPFHIAYKTSEMKINSTDVNQGFCLDFEQS